KNPPSRRPAHRPVRRCRGGRRKAFRRRERLIRVPPPAAKPRSYRTRVGAYRWLLTLAAGVFLLDQVSKIWINQTLPLNTVHPYGSITLIPGFFHLVHVSNTGAAWSLFPDKSLWLAALAV